jgi:hypothetical protein
MDLKARAQSLVLETELQASHSRLSNIQRDTSLFFYSQGNIHMFVLIYVDDIIVTSSL